MIGTQYSSGFLPEASRLLSLSIHNQILLEWGTSAGCVVLGAAHGQCTDATLSSHPANAQFQQQPLAQHGYRPWPRGWQWWKARGNPYGTSSRRHVHSTSLQQQPPPLYSDAADHKHRLVFLGTPDFAAGVLADLCAAAAQPGATFEVQAVVSKRLPGRGSPSSPSGSPYWRPGALGLTPVLREALAQGMQPHQMLCPSSAKETAFLDALEALAPDVCVTAAYGALLPQRFLDIPRCGTLNVHPSLLPRYRGAAPVQRCLQDGCDVTGVSVVSTVLECDAGPVLAQQEVQVAEDEQAPELTTRLFSLGARLLLAALPGVLEGRGPAMGLPQDHAAATFAPKLRKEECFVDLMALSADCVHNRVRAFIAWPGSRVCFMLEDPATGSQTPLELKVLRTRVITHAAQLGWVGLAAERFIGSGAASVASAAPDPIPGRDVEGGEGRGGPRGGVTLAGLPFPLPASRASMVNGRMLVPCGQGTVLELMRVRYSRRGDGHGAAAGATLTGGQFMAGVGKRRLLIAHPPVSVTEPWTVSDMKIA